MEKSRGIKEGEDHLRMLGKKGYSQIFSDKKIKMCLTF